MNTDEKPAMTDLRARAAELLERLSYQTKIYVGLGKYDSADLSNDSAILITDLLAALDGAENDGVFHMTAQKTAEAGVATLYRHKKTGGLYERLLPMGRIQSSSPLNDMDEVAIYRSQKNGTLWARKASEFDDGRFEPVALARKGATPAPSSVSSRTPEPPHEPQ